MFQINFLSAPAKAIVLPSTAIMQEQDNAYILVEAAKGKYIRRKVEAETAHRNTVRIISGVEEGENVVVEGGIYLQ